MGQRLLCTSVYHYKSWPLFFNLHDFQCSIVVISLTQKLALSMSHEKNSEILISQKEEMKRIENYHVGNPIFRLFFSKDFQKENLLCYRLKNCHFWFLFYPMPWFRIPVTQGMGHIFILSLSPFTSIVLDFGKGKKCHNFTEYSTVLQNHQKCLIIKILTLPKYNVFHSCKRSTLFKNETVLLDFQTLWHSPKISLIFQAKNYNDVRP